MDRRVKSTWTLRVDHRGAGSTEGGPSIADAAQRHLYCPRPFATARVTSTSGAWSRVWYTTSIDVATEFSVTPAHAASAWSSMSPEHTDVPAPVAEHCAVTRGP